MRKIFTALFLLSTTLICAAPVDVRRASVVGESFLTGVYCIQPTRQTKRADIELSLVYTPTKAIVTKEAGRTTESAPYYIFSMGERGFVIVAGDDRVQPILGYSRDSKLDKENMPPNMKYWLEGYENEIRYAVNNDVQPTEEVKRSWQGLYAGKGVENSEEGKAVEPLIETRWNQMEPYNLMCPYDEGLGMNIATGCVATAMAQILKYWEYPTKGIGKHAYVHEDYDTLSARFAATEYDWGNMPAIMSEYSTDKEKDAVATLMYHCGVSIDMDYNVDGAGSSGAFTFSSWAADSEVTAEAALKRYFGYSKSLHGEAKEDYSNETWEKMLRAELDSARPVIYTGENEEQTSSHCFVCDGYDSNGLFHFNWGWGGYCDGYFELTSLIPSGTGTGGGDGDYTFRQMAMFGVKPGDASGDIQPEDAPIGMYSDLTSEEFKTFLSLPVTLTARIANYDSEPFAGAISAGVFDRSGALVEYLDTIGIEDLPSEGDTLLTFTRQKKELILTGKYIAKLFYADSSKVEGEGDKAEWVLIPDSTGINYTEFEVYYPAEMEVYSPFVIKGDSLEHLKTATVGVAVSNEGMANFKGKYRLSLSGLDGIFAQEIATVTDMSGSLAPGYYIPLEFKGKITVPPGDYLMELSYMPSGKNQWYYAGSSYYQNPIRVRVGGTLEPVGVEEVVEQEVTIYPNPAKDYAIIRTENGYSKIVLSDIQGRIVYTTTGNNTAMTAEIPLANVGSGVYVVQIYSDNRVITRKIIVQK